MSAVSDRPYPVPLPSARSGTGADAGPGGPFAPPPPADLACRELPLETVPAGGRFYRIHRKGRAALHFGTGGRGRFDAPDGRFGVCYVARDVEGCFVEVFLRAVGDTLVRESELAARAVSAIEVRPGAAPLRLVELRGRGLVRLGATGAVASGPYDASRAWAAALWRHPAAPDGILYHARHDDTRVCAALFDRCAVRLGERPQGGRLDARRRLAAIHDHYGVGLIR